MLYLYYYAFLIIVTVLKQCFTQKQYLNIHLNYYYYFFASGLTSKFYLMIIIILLLLLIQFEYAQI